MTLDKDVALLGRLPVFEKFPVDHLRLIAFSAEPLNLPEGTVLFRQDAAADGGFVIASGAVEFYTEGPEGEVIKGVAGPGALIGELALLCPTTRPSNARTVQPTELLAISRRLLRRVLEEYPDIAEVMRHALARRLAGMNADLARARETLTAGDGESEEAAG